jgi:hypothetical protein
VKAVATGGYPDYTYVWEDGSTDPTRRLCPTANSAYSVSVTDSGINSSEFHRSPETVTASVTAEVLDCSPDAGRLGTGGLDGGPIDTAGCDDLARSFSATANPSPPWAYGFAATLGSAFTPYTTYVAPPDCAAQIANLHDLAVWWTPNPLGTPSALFNPSAQPVNGSGSNPFTMILAPSEFGLHPGLFGEYSMARWTAREAGPYVAQATFEGLHKNGATPITTTDVHIQHNGVDVASGFLNLSGAGNVFSASPAFNVAVGDTIDFAVGNGNNGYTSDGVGVGARVCPPPK